MKTPDTESFEQWCIDTRCILRNQYNKSDPGVFLLACLHEAKFTPDEAAKDIFDWEEKIVESKDSPSYAYWKQQLREECESLYGISVSELVASYLHNRGVYDLRAAVSGAFLYYMGLQHGK